MGLDATTLGIAATLGPVILLAIGRERARRRRARAALERAERLGLTEPATLHPVIDPSRCIGCGSCVEACPEPDVLRLVDGRAQVVNAASCVGHGRCKAACCNETIELVFGTEKRGIQLSEVDGGYQSNVSGLYIAGELGSMGLIRNAMTQGLHAAIKVARGLSLRERASWFSTRFEPMTLRHTPRGCRPVDGKKRGSSSRSRCKTQHADGSTTPSPVGSMNRHHGIAGQRFPRKRCTVPQARIGSRAPLTPWRDPGTWVQ